MSRTAIKGIPVIRYYKSVEEMLRAVYPEYSWDSEQFQLHQQIRRSTRLKANNALAKAAEHLGIKEVNKNNN